MILTLGVEAKALFIVMLSYIIEVLSISSPLTPLISGKFLISYRGLL